MRELRRHYVKEQHGNVNKTMIAFHQAMELRRKYPIHLIRRIPEAHQIMEDSLLSLEEKQQIQRYHQLIQQEFENQPTICFVSRQQQQEQQQLHSGGAAVVGIRFPRIHSQIDFESYIIIQLYVAERGMAMAEFHTTTQQQQQQHDIEPRLATISEFQHYDPSNALPFKYLKASFDTLQQIYPKRLKQLILMDPPLPIRLLYNLLYPFLREQIKQKIRVTSGLQQRRQVLEEYLFMDLSTTTTNNNPFHFIIKMVDCCFALSLISSLIMLSEVIASLIASLNSNLVSVVPF